MLFKLQEDYKKLIASEKLSEISKEEIEICDVGVNIRRVL